MALGVLERVRRFFALEDSDSYSISNNSMEMGGTASSPLRPRSNIVSLNNARRQQVVQQIVLTEPSSFGEARDVAEALKQKKPIIVNVRKTDKDLARRIIDFLEGISYAIDGRQHKIADQIYIFTPATVELMPLGAPPEYQKEQDPLFRSQ